MQVRTFVSVYCAVFLSLGLVGAADKTEGEDAGNPAASKAPSVAKQETIVYPVQGVPAHELASTLGKVFDPDEARVVAEPTSNLLIIKVSAKSRAAVLQLLGKLDKPLRSMVIQLHLLKTRGKDAEPLDSKALSGPSDAVIRKINEMQKAGRIYVANRMELTVVENQKAILQVGERVSVATGQMTRGSGPAVKSYSDMSVGTLISVMTRASEDGAISMQLQFEKSEVVAAKEKEEKADFEPSGIATLTQQTTVVLASGHSTLAGTMVAHSPGAEPQEAYLVVGAQLVDSSASGKPILFRSFAQQSPRGTARTRETAGGFRPSGDSGGRFKAYARSLVARYDKNKDGALTSDEWKAMPEGTPAADKDKDGKITVEEFAAWIPSRGVFSSRTRSTRERGSPSTFAEAAGRYAATLLARYDENRDEVIDAKEREKSSRDISPADKNDDGKITKQELTDWLLTKRPPR